MDEEERVDYEEEEVTYYRKTKRTQSTMRKKKANEKNDDGGTVKTEVKLNPFLVGARNRETYSKPDVPESFRKSDYVQKLVKDTLNEYKGTDLPQIKTSHRLFLGECDFDEENSEILDDVEVVDVESHSKKVWKFSQKGKKGLDRFRRIVEFVILAQQVFTCRRSVSLNRRDSILFFMDREAGNSTTTGSDSEPKFDLNSFKSLGQKTKTASVKACLQVPPSDRTDAQVNHMVHMMRNFSRFSSYPHAVQTGLCRKGWYAIFESSKVLVKEGNKAEFYYLILSGLAIYRDIDTKVDELDNPRNSLVASFLKPGDTLGEKEILTNAERPATVVCKEPVEVLGVDRETLLDIFKAAGGPGSIEYLKTIPELMDFPLELLQTYHFSMAVHYYRRGTVIVKSSNESEWIYIIRSGSCQVYKAIKESHKSVRDTQYCSQSGLPKHRSSDASSGLILPMINRTKNEMSLKSASTDDLAETSKKKQKKKKQPTIERSHTMTLPVLNPGKTSLLQNQSQEPQRLQTPNLQTLRKQSSKENTRRFSDSPKTPRKKHTTTPDLLRLSRNHMSICDTPESLRSPILSHSQSPSSESRIDINMNRNSVSSESDLNEYTSRTPRQKYPSSSDSDYLGTAHMKTKHTDSPESVLSIDTGGSLFYVRLGVISENGVFGLHPLVYDDMPNLSLVSNGAECVLVSKQFLKDQMNSTLVHRLRRKLPPYPNSGQLRVALDDQMNWESYREKVVNDVVN